MYERALDIVVVRGLASATVEAMSEVASAAALGGTESRSPR